jgi:hypothetical protein
MKTKMIITLLDKHIEVFEFKTEYTSYKIEDGMLLVYRDIDVKKIYAKGFWQSIEFNRG